MNNEMTTDNMSNEEVIEVLKGIVFNGFDRTTRKERQALDLAIKALEERPKGDLISREALREAFKAWKTMDDYYHNTDGNGIPFSEAFDLIDNAPTVEANSIIDGLNNEIDDLSENLVWYINERNRLLKERRPQGECKKCKHFKESLCENSPNGWCSIRRATQEGDLETQVPKDYYCSWFEKGGAE